MENILINNNVVSLSQNSDVTGLLPGQTLYTGSTPKGVTPRIQLRLIVGPTRMKKGVKKTLCQLKAYVDIDTSLGTVTREITSNYTIIGEDSPDGYDLQLMVAQAHIVAMAQSGMLELVRRVKRNAIGTTPVDAAKVTALMTAIGTVAE